jgi:hypothetical protein
MICALLYAFLACTTEDFTFTFTFCQYHLRYQVNHNGQGQGFENPLCVKQLISAIFLAAGVWELYEMAENEDKWHYPNKQGSRTVSRQNYPAYTVYYIGNFLL